MKVILLKDVLDLGFEADTVDVAKGYARNYLIPKGMALEATDRNIKIMETRRDKIEARKLKARDEAEKLKETLSGISVAFKHKAGDEGKLYGSVTNMDIVSGLEKQGIVVDKKKILLDRPLKELGEHEVGIKLYPEVTASVKVIVEKLEEEQA